MATEAYPGTVELNGKKYVLRGPLVKGRVDEYVEGTPTSTEQLRTARRYLQVGAVTTIKGLLVSRDDDNSLQSAWDSTLETRFADQICLPAAWAAITPVVTLVGDDANAQKFVGPVPFYDSTYGPTAIMAVKKSTNTDVMISVYWPANDYYGSVAGLGETIAGDGANAVSVHDLKTHGPHAFLVFSYSTTRKLYRTTNAGSYAMSNPLSPDPGNFPDNMANATDRTLLCSVGAKLFLVCWISSTGEIRVHYSTDNGVTWTTAATTKASSGYEPTAAIAYQDEDGVECLHVGTAEGVYRYDSTGDNPILILNLRQQTAQYNCKGMAVWGQTGALYVTLDTYPQGQVYEYSIQNGVRYVRPVGLNLGAGVPSYKAAQVVQLVPQGQWLFALTRTSTACFVYAFDGEGWHHVFNSTYTPSSGWSTDPTTKAFGMAFIPLPLISEGPAIHVAYWNVTAGGTKTIRHVHMHFALENPLTGTIPPCASGFIDLPYFSGGSSEIKTLALQCRVDADNLDATTSGNYIKAQYGTNGAARTTTTLGNFLSGAKKLPIASGAGVEVNTIGFRLTIYQNGATYPALYAFATEFMKQPTARHTFQFLVDVKATAIAQARTEEEVYDELEALEAVTTQITFSAPGVSQKYTKLSSNAPTFRWDFPDQRWDNPLEVHHGEGLVAVSLVELVS